MNTVSRTIVTAVSLLLLSFIAYTLFLSNGSTIDGVTDILKLLSPFALGSIIAAIVILSGLHHSNIAVSKKRIYGSITIVVVLIMRAISLPMYGDGSWGSLGIVIMGVLEIAVLVLMGVFVVTMKRVPEKYRDTVSILLFILLVIVFVLSNTNIEFSQKNLEEYQSLAPQEQLQKARSSKSSLSSTSSKSTTPYLSVSEVEEHYEKITDYFYRDDNNVYLHVSTGLLSLVEEADPDSFEVFLNGSYARDNTHLFAIYQEMGGPYIRLIEKIDPQTFEVLEHGYTRDKNGTYYYSKIQLEELDPSSFRILGIVEENPYGDIYRFSRDNTHLYFAGFLLRDVDPDAVNIHGGGIYYLLEHQGNYSAIVPFGQGGLHLPIGVAVVDIIGTEVIQGFAPQRAEENHRIAIVDSENSYFVHYDSEGNHIKTDTRKGHYTVDF